METGHNPAEKGSGNSHLKFIPVKINEGDLSSHRKEVHLREGSPTELSEEAKWDQQALLTLLFLIRNRNDCTNSTVSLGRMWGIAYRVGDHRERLSNSIWSFPATPLL